MMVIYFLGEGEEGVGLTGILDPERDRAVGNLRGRMGRHLKSSILQTTDRKGDINGILLIIR